MQKSVADCESALQTNQLYDIQSAQSVTNGCCQVGGAGVGGFDAAADEPVAAEGELALGVEVIGGSALLGDVGVAPAVDGFVLGVANVLTDGLAALLAEVVDDACAVIIYMSISPIVGGVY